MKKIYKAADLFAGIGGIRLGFQQAFKDKIEFVFSNEIDSYCCQTYIKNFKDNPKGDIRKINIKKIPDFDILMAGFPCQAFSIAGKKKGFEDERSNLFFYIEDILQEKKPIAFLLENVKFLLYHDNKRTFRAIKNILEDKLRYNTHYILLDAQNFGLAQRRVRIYIIGFKKNLKFTFPKGKDNSVKLKDILEDDVDVKYYLSQNYLNYLKRSIVRYKAKGYGFGYTIRDRNDVAGTIAVGGGGTEGNLIKDKIKYDCWKLGDDLQKKKNNEGLRKMTGREWARLQGFPDDFKFPVSLAQTLKQLGNSVPVSVIKAIALEMKKSLENNILFKSKRTFQDDIYNYL